MNFSFTHKKSIDNNQITPYGIESYKYQPKRAYEFYSIYSIYLVVA